MSEKPKVLRILNRFNLGGPIYNASYLTKDLANDFETLLIGGQKLEEEESALFIPQSLGIEAIEIPEMTRSVGLISEIKTYRRISEIIRQFKPDIVHTHASKAGAIGRMAASRNGVKHIVHTFHGHVFEHYFDPVRTKLVIGSERFLAKKSQAIIAISDKQKMDLVEKFRIAPADKVHTIPLGFDLERFKLHVEEKREKFRNKYGLKEGDIAIGIIGRLAPIKNHPLFIRVFADLKKNHPAIRAFIIGDGNLKHELKEQCRSLGLTVDGDRADVVFTSWIKRIEEVIHGLDIIALTSFNEGTPVSLIEAQAAGKVLISSNVGGVRDVVYRDSGLLFKNDDASDFRKKLNSLILSTDKVQMGNIGKEWVFSRFGRQRLANDVKKLYLNLLNEDER
jgi:glycosyltransferase involved in cell wall biosynthesis